MDANHPPGPWDLIDGEIYSANGRLIASDVARDARRLVRAAPELLEALKVARDFMSIASDWNVDEAEINGEMRSTYDWLAVVDAALAKATGATNV